jgi:hypothetical protein
VLTTLRAKLQQCDKSLICNSAYRRYLTDEPHLATRPFYHQTDSAIRGHGFCSFLALVLRKELQERLAAAQLKPEWRALLADLDRLQGIEVEQDGKHFTLRTPVTSVAGWSFSRRRRRDGGALRPRCAPTTHWCRIIFRDALSHLGMGLPCVACHGRRCTRHHAQYSSGHRVHPS